MNRDMRPYALLLELGWTLAVSIVGSLVIGVLFDRFMGTSPVGLLVFSLLGILAGSVSVYRQVTAAIAAVEEEERQRKRDRDKKEDE
ncbi:MAG: AtpZ/AtpI family protein [Chloroflexi bacterium]|nr:AtpZ/AtpI family protein [Chloroflexota bacterium]